jgi:hypothetical protein
MNIAAIKLDPNRYVPHEVHSSERIWTETNCYVDLWIELLHSLGFEPLACSAFALSGDFDGDQWSFLKFPPEDLRGIFNINVTEMNVWRSVLDHVEEQLHRGRLLTVEVDSFFLPDTAGVSYGLGHTKSTIVPWSVDREKLEMTYFHNAGFFELSGENFEGVFRLGKFEDERALPPYVEIINLDDATSAEDPTKGALALTRRHLEHRKATNPIRRMREKIEADREWLTSQTIDMFHLYSFGLFRQCGAGAELSASYLDWLDERDGGGLHDAAEELRSVAANAKSLQFAMARLARKRNADIEAPFAQMEASWERAMGRLVARYGC